MARSPLPALVLLSALAGTVAFAQEKPAQALAPEPGIAWFATWKSGLAEAARSGRPILLVAAAPHCGGVPGIW